LVRVARGSAILETSVYREYQKALEEELRENLSSRQGFLYDLLRYHLGWTDERGHPLEDSDSPLHFQPALAFAVCQVLHGDFTPARPAAAAVELAYNFTVVHGEVQLGRTGHEDRPSIWWVWGPAQAINAGDGLHALARAAIMRLSRRNAPPLQVLQAVEALDRACLALCEGQFLDLTFRDQLMVTSADYYSMIERKSGALAGCAAALGALAPGVDDRLFHSFHKAGSRLGMARQVAQDVNDLWGPQGDGLTASNVLNKKKSLPLIYALDTASTAARRELVNIYMKRVLESEDITRIVAIMDEVGARRYAQEQAQKLRDQAWAALADVNLTQQQLSSLEPLGRWALEGLP
jgi:geranylgeranyl diphosphate synthase, type I